MGIISDPSGGILRLVDARREYPDSGLIVYHRVSSWGQAGRKKVKLEEKTMAVVNEVRALAPGRLRRIVPAVEEGKLSTPRPLLREAAMSAKNRGCILVAADLSRFIRSEAYDRQKNPAAVPTADELALLREMTGGVALATVADPDLTEAERMSLAIRRTGGAGRPSTIDDELAAKIFAELGYLVSSISGRMQWERPIRKVAKAYGVSTAAVVRAAERESPSGKTWRQEALEKAAALGLHVIGEDGRIIAVSSFGSSSSRGWWGKRGRPPKWVKKWSR